MRSRNYAKDVVALGPVVYTPAALAALAAVQMSPDIFLRRHARGDWGDVSTEVKRANNEAVMIGGPLLSAYRLPSGEKILVVEESDSPSKTVSLSSEY